MQLLYLASYIVLITLCQVLYCHAASCGCGIQSCTNIQVGYHTYIPDWCTEQSSMSESECYDHLLQSSTAWIVNYRPDTSECRISECDTSSVARMSIYGLKMYRKICGSACSNYTLEKFTSCWAEPPPPAVQTRHYITSDINACQQNCVPPNASSCIIRYDSYSDVCDVYVDVDVTTPPVCTQTASGYTSYYVTCYDIVQCGTPDPITNGMVSYSDLTVSSTATYSCTSTGYELIGTTTITCQSDKLWSTPLPTCQLVDCGTPPSVTNATISPAIPVTTYGSFVVYNCETSYTLSGTATISCLQTGQWETLLPTCQIVDCSTPPSVTNATISPAIPLTTYGSSVVYSCETGFTLSGTATISCLQTGQWDTPLPTCQIVDCSTPPSVTNATISPAVPITTYGSSVVYSCETGFTLSGTATISCLQTGQWETPLPSCQIVNCNAPPTITGATVSAMNTTYKSSAVYSCSGLYSLVGNETVSCLHDGQWGPIIPTCNIANCSDPPNVTNATVSYTGTIQGSYATYTCIANHSRIGSPTVTCLVDGNWTQPTLICAPKGNQVTTVPHKLYITPCVCSIGSYFINMTVAEIIETLIADTEINTRDTTLSQYSLKCRQDGRTSSLITGLVGISVLSIIFGTFFILDFLKLCTYFKKTEE